MGNPPGSRDGSAVRRTQLKREWRQRLRARRRALSRLQREDDGLRCAEVLTAWRPWLRAQHIALYLPNDGEVETAPIIAAARAAGKVVYLPVVSDRDLDFVSWAPGEALAPNRYGIGEPARGVPESRPPDLLLMPLVGWGAGGERLGMGGGYYDRALRRDGWDKAQRVGLGFDCQELPATVAAAIVDDWDAGLDAVVTASGVREFVRRPEAQRSAD